ncbi:MAG: 2-keto-4-pentenoate hydratase [Planctomycetota bacterium]|nr:MAG: 2-keto-4-pentenoate hydratase [Planctomycetota bacterium]
MILATLKNENLDGYLISIDLVKNTYSYFQIKHITFQFLLDHWSARDKLLIIDKENSNMDLNTIPRSDFMAPLPRTYQWLDGSTYLNHVTLARKSRGAEFPESFKTEPLMYQGAGDNFLGPYDSIKGLDEQWGIDLEAEIGVITDFVPQGISAEDACEKCLFLIGINDISLRNLIPEELKKGFGFINGKPSTAFAPFAVSVDSLQDSFKNGVPSFKVNVLVNDKTLGCLSTQLEMQFHFGKLISHAAKTRNLGAGTIIGSGTISNSIENGYACLTEKRMDEKISSGEMTTPFLSSGDSIKIEFEDKNGAKCLGTIEQSIE